MQYHHPHTVDTLFEAIPTESRKVACDGGGGALGHPRVYLTIDASDASVICPYCSRTYIYTGHGHHDH